MPKRKITPSDQIKATQNTIARLAGVNRSTVSRVLNDKTRKGKPVISQERREEILQLCKKLNYKPNVLARAFATQTTRTIGVAGYLDWPIFNTVLLHAQKEAFNQGYLLSFLAFDAYQSADNALDDMFNLWHYDGFWSVGSSVSYQAPIVKHCTDRNIPLVFVGQPLGCQGIDNVKCIGGDLQKGVADLIDYLYKLGHRKYLCLLPNIKKPKQDVVSALIQKHIEAELKDKNVPAKDMSVLNIPHEAHGTLNITRDYFRKLKQDVPYGKWPSVVIVISQVIGALHGIKEVGIPVPDGISLVGFNPCIVGLENVLRPPIAVIEEPYELLAEESIKTLVKMINNPGNKTTPFEHTNFPMVFRKNQSCKPLNEMQWRK